MKKILAFAGSNSSTSINQRLVKYAAGLSRNAEVTVIDIRDYDAPIYSADLEKAEGQPQSMMDLLEIIYAHDAYIIASPEHNGMMPAVFKNVVDWISRIDRKFFADKPILLMSTSPGAGGGKRSLAGTQSMMGYFGGNVLDVYSLPKFFDEMNLETNTLISDEESVKLRELVQRLEAA